MVDQQHMQVIPVTAENQLMLLGKCVIHSAHLQSNHAYFSLVRLQIQGERNSYDYGMTEICKSHPTDAVCNLPPSCTCCASTLQQPARLAALTSKDLGF